MALEPRPARALFLASCPKLDPLIYRIALGLCLLSCAAMGSARAHDVEPESLDNRIRIQVDDRLPGARDWVLSAEVLSAPAWITVSAPEFQPGRIPHFDLSFDVGEVPLGEAGVLRVRFQGTSAAGSARVDRVQEISLDVRNHAEPIQRGFQIDECCLATADVPDASSPLPSHTLVGVLPNPVRTFANITFGLAGEGGAVELRVFDVQGRTIQEIVTPHLDAGFHKIAWDGSDSSGRDVGPGVYFYKISSGDWTETRKLQILR